jgi:hypothetical protein
MTLLYFYSLEILGRAVIKKCMMPTGLFYIKAIVTS